MNGCCRTTPTRGPNGTGARVHLKPNLLGKVNPQSPGMQLPDEYPDAYFRPVAA